MYVACRSSEALAGHSAWSFSGRRGRRLPGRRGAGRRRRNCGDERVPEGVRPDGLGDPGAAGYPADDPGGAVPVQPPAARGEEDGSFAAFPGGQVDRPRCAWCERDGDDLAALAGDHQGPVPALHPQRLDIGAGCLGDAQPVEGQQGDQRVLRGRAEPGGDQQCAELASVQPGSVRLIVQPRPAHMGSRGMARQFFPGRVAVEPRDRAQPPGHGSPRTAPGLQVTGEALDIRATDTE
jgi:hypothetical protein